MSDQETTKPSTSSTKPEPSKDKTDAVKAAQADALTPDQKHKNYLDDIERLHNEP
jgi:hypothetical protein